MNDYLYRLFINLNSGIGIDGMVCWGGSFLSLSNGDNRLIILMVYYLLEDATLRVL